MESDGSPNSQVLSTELSAAALWTMFVAELFQVMEARLNQAVHVRSLQVQGRVLAKERKTKSVLTAADPFESESHTFQGGQETRHTPTYS